MPRSFESFDREVFSSSFANKILFEYSLGDLPTGDLPTGDRWAIEDENVVRILQRSPEELRGFGLGIPRCRLGIG